jgi:tetratricopeptide (TPR) repeat protein
MALDDAMRAFIDESIGRTHQKSAVLGRLLRSMQEHGFFTLEYVVDDTHTARETFHAKRGNCISFTMLFVTLARESGLRASYQIVDVPPVWNAATELTVIANHINALIELPSGRDYIVDFNESSYNARYEREKISDEHALALFFNNLGAEAMLRQDPATAFHYFREAITLDPDVADPWVNLGLLYARHERYQHAEGAYLRALDVEPTQRSALTNLANLYDALGNAALAEQYSERIRRYQQRNPYYHFVVAQQAFEANRLEEAQQAMKRAIQLKRDDHDFHYLLGLTQIELGELARATASLQRARDYADTGALKAKYDEVLASVREEQVTAVDSLR